MIRTELVYFLSHPTPLFIAFQKVYQNYQNTIKVWPNYQNVITWLAKFTKIPLLGWQKYKVDQIYKFSIGLFWAFLILGFLGLFLILGF
jgi:hypothetical protein